MQACPNMQACACASTSNKTGVNLEHASTSMHCRNCRMNMNLTMRGHPFCDLERLPFMLVEYCLILISIVLWRLLLG